jgi:nitrogen fixation/metabolism regulation signal transduction histidine kinase
MDDQSYIIDKRYDDKNLAEYILATPTKNFKVAMFNDKKELRHFSINVSIIEINNNIIVTLTDITAEIRLMEVHKEKDRLLFQQSKITAISDTLKNIAHQWRQPLSIISTIASGMKVQKELNLLDNTQFDNSCDSIVENTQKLSTTIDNFSTFFTKEDNKSTFQLIESLQDIINFLNATFEKNNIQCSISFDNEKILNCYKTDFSQAIFNILNNSIYALINNKKENERFILLNLKIIY